MRLISLRGRRNPLSLPALLLCVCSLAGCTIFGPDSERAEPSGLVISGGSSFGECLGYCRVSLTVWQGGMTLVRQGWGDRQYPDLLYDRDIAAQEWHALLRLVDEQQFSSLDEVYGCPDCADGGAEWIEIASERGTHRVTFEFGGDVRSIEPLIERLRAIREDWLASL